MLIIGHMFSQKITYNHINIEIISVHAYLIRDIVSDILMFYIFLAQLNESASLMAGRVVLCSRETYTRWVFKFELRMRLMPISFPKCAQFLQI